MREIIYFSRNARTSGNFNDLMKAGRMDIVCHVIIMSFFVSNNIRENVKLHLFFYGAPDPPKHLEIMANRNISKKDVAGLIKRMLYKYKKGRKIEAFENCFVEKNSLIKVVEELAKTRNVYLLDRNGENIRETEIKEDPIFILGDHEGLPKKELKRISKNAIKISLGKVNYFSSQIITILNNELDIRGIN